MLTQEQKTEITRNQGDKAPAIIKRYDDAQTLVTNHAGVKARAAQIDDVAKLAPETLAPSALLARIEALEAAK